MPSIISVQKILAQPDNRQLVADLLKSDTVVTRSDLAKELCQRLSLRDGKGDWRLATTQKALRVLESQGLWKLPKASAAGSGEWKPTRLHKPVAIPKAVPATVGEVQGLQLIVVTTESELQIWNELMFRCTEISEVGL